VTPWWTYTRTKPETVDRAKEHLQLTATSSTRRLSGVSETGHERRGLRQGLVENERSPESMAEAF
jgi:hypothetical protein